MSKRSKEILKECSWVWEPFINPTGASYSVHFGGDFEHFEHYGNAEFFAGEIGKGMKRKPQIRRDSKVRDYPMLNPNIKADFAQFWEMWQHLIKHAETIAQGGKLANWNSMMISAYSAGLWYFRKAMHQIEENHQETMKELEILKRRIDELEEMI